MMSSSIFNKYDVKIEMPPREQRKHEDGHCYYDIILLLLNTKP